MKQDYITSICFKGLKKAIIFLSVATIPLIIILLVVVLIVAPFMWVGDFLSGAFGMVDANENIDSKNNSGQVLVDEWIHNNKISFSYDEFLSCTFTITVDNDSTNSVEKCLDGIDDNGKITIDNYTVDSSNNIYGQYKTIKEYKGKISEDLFRKIHIQGSYQIAYKSANGEWITRPEVYQGKCRALENEKCIVLKEDEDSDPYVFPSNGIAKNRYGFKNDSENFNINFVYYIEITGDPIAVSSGEIIEASDDKIIIKSNLYTSDFKFIYEGKFKNYEDVGNVISIKDEIAKSENSVFKFSVLYKDEYINPAILFKIPEYYTSNGIGYPFTKEYPITARVGTYDPFGTGEIAHNGTDFGAPEWTPVLAVTDGIVTQKSLNDCATDGDKSTACMIGIRTKDNLTIRYLHFVEPSKLKLGNEVKAGDVIGYVGSTGPSTGNHLHLEIRDPDYKVLDYCNFIDCNNPPLKRSEE